MAVNTLPRSEPQPRRVMPLRAILEIIDGKLKIYPLADSDVDEHQIRDALRVIHEGHQ